MSDRAEPLPTPLRWAVWLLALEASVVGAVAAFLVYEGFTEEVTSLVDALALAGYVAIMAAALAGIGFALSRRKTRARAPAIVLQLLGVVVAYFLTTAGLVWLSLPVIALALVVITLLLVPATSEALTS